MNSTEIFENVHNLVCSIPYVTSISKALVGILGSIFIYFTAAPFLIKYIILPTINKIYNFYQHQISWKKKNISSYVTCTLCILKTNPETGEKEFFLRTLFERHIKDMVYGNLQAMNILQESSKQTTMTNSWLVFPKDSSWIILNAILNQISEMFAVGHLGFDFNLPVHSDTYVYGVTYTRNPEIYMHKYRILLMKESTLLKLSPDFSKVIFKNPVHNLAYKGLYLMRLKVEEELSGKKSDNFLIKELGDFSQSFHRISLSILK
eukprot:gene478-6888_t